MFDFIAFERITIKFYKRFAHLPFFQFFDHNIKFNYAKNVTVHV